MTIRAKSSSILGTFCFNVGSVIALAGAQDLLAIVTRSGSFSKVFWTLGGGYGWCTHTDDKVLHAYQLHILEGMFQLGGVEVRDVGDSCA